MLEKVVEVGSVRKRDEAFENSLLLGIDKLADKLELSLPPGYSTFLDDDQPFQL